MEIIINGTPKEITELALELQARQSVSLTPQSIIVKDLADCTAVDFSAAQKTITDAYKNVREESSTPKYETREIHIFRGNATDSDLQNQEVKERTFGDLKKAFEKITKASADLRSDEKRFEEMKRAFTKFIDSDGKSFKKGFLDKDIQTSETPINHDPPEGYIHISDLSLAVSDYIADQRLRKDKSVLADPFVHDQPLSEFIKAYWSKHCDPQSSE